MFQSHKICVGCKKRLEKWLNNSLLGFFNNKRALSIKKVRPFKLKKRLENIKWASCYDQAEK